MAILKDVVLKYYDISRGIASYLAPIFLQLNIEGIWHTGIVVDSLEYFFAGGIVCMPPEDVERLYGIVAKKSVVIGQTSRTTEEIMEWIGRNNSKFTEQTYDLIKWNCNHFTNELSQYLLDGQGIPEDILGMVDRIMQTPLGRRVVPFLQTQQESYARAQKESGNTSLWSRAENSDWPHLSQEKRSEIDSIASELLTKAAGGAVDGNGLNEVLKRLKSYLEAAESPNTRLDEITLQKLVELSKNKDLANLLKLLQIRVEGNEVTWKFDDPGAATRIETLQVLNYIRAKMKMTPSPSSVYGVSRTSGSQVREDECMATLKEMGIEDTPRNREIVRDAQGDIGIAVERIFQ